MPHPLPPSERGFHPHSSARIGVAHYCIESGFLISPTPISSGFSTPGRMAIPGVFSLDALRRLFELASLKNNGIDY